MIDAHTLAQCKPGVRIINCARGGIIHEGDLLAAVQSGVVGGVSLDTFEVEPPEEASFDLRMHPNVIVTPHLGASTSDAQVTTTSTYLSYYLSFIPPIQSKCLY